MDIRHFKLTTNEELLCEVVEYHDDDDALVIRKSLKLVCMDNMETGNRYYSFRPFMMYQLESDSFQILSAQHILGETHPHDDMLSEYFKALSTLMEDTEDGNISVDKMRREMREHMDSMEKKVDSILEGNESDELGKILKFKTKPILH